LFTHCLHPRRRIETPADVGRMRRRVQSRTISRKVVEILMSMYLERRMGKPAIMEAYLNNVYWSAPLGRPLLPPALH
jgi:membrane carboxypeptidase/penicillin-binding protein PbpC